MEESLPTRSTGALAVQPVIQDSKGVKRQELINTSWLAAATLLLRGSQAGFLVLAALQLTPADFGQFAIASAISAFGLLAAEGGYAQATTTLTDVDSESERHLAARALSVGFLVASVCIGIGFAFTLLDGFGDVGMITACLVLTVPFAATASVSTGRLQRQSAFAKISRAQMISTAVACTACAISIAFGYALSGLILLSVIATGLTAILIILRPETRIWPTFRGRADPSLRKRANYALVANITGLLGRRSGDIMVGLALGPAAAGQFSLAYRVLTTVTEAVLHSQERVYLSKIKKFTDRSMNSIDFARSFQIRAFVIAGPVFLVVGIGCYVLMPLMGGDWSGAAPVCLVLAAAGVAQSTWNLCYATIYVLESPRRALGFQAAMVVVLVSGLAAGLPIGLTCAAATYAVVSLLVGCWCWFVKFRPRFGNLNEKSYE